jgi:hypothetical protein
MMLLTSCEDPIASPTPYDQKTCDLRRMAIKGRISRVYTGHEKVFFIDGIDESFPFHFNLSDDSYREINEVEKGEIYMLPVVGDSIFKKAGSKYIKFKRKDKIFIESLKLNGCN